MNDDRLLVVALHDVAPPFARDISNQVEALASLGIQHFAIKIVPNWHGAHKLSDNDQFCRLLNGWVENGAEPVLHGYTHLSAGKWRGSPLRQARARFFAPTAAEFMTLPAGDARLALEAGIQEFAAAQLARPQIFCAPGWLMTDEAEEAVAECGIRFVTGMFSLLDLHEGRLAFVPSSGYMGGGKAHETGIRMLNGIVKTAVRRSDVRKIYLHPDTSGHQRWRKTVDCITALINAGWQPTTFEQLASQIFDRSDPA